MASCAGPLAGLPPSTSIVPDVGDSMPTARCSRVVFVAHHLSVVVLQAAGARASGQASEGTLEKIEHSGRQSLTEMRRLLGMLREPDDEPELTPQPGLGGLPTLAESVRLLQHG